MIHDICLLCVNVFVIIRIFMLWLSLYMHSTHYTLVSLVSLVHNEIIYNSLLTSI